MADRRAPRGALSRERILDAAMELIDAHGIDAFSMRRLGAHLGVDPMAVYHHIGGKRAIVLALVERVFAGFQVPDTAGTWQERVRAWARAYRELALAHPGLVLQIVSDPQAVAIAAMHANEPLVAALKEAGLAPATVVAAINVTVDYVHGAVLPAAARDRRPDHAPPSGRPERGRPADERFPAQRWLAAELGEDREDAEGFERGVDVIVAGLDALRPAGRVGAGGRGRRQRRSR
jgi:TetR/AcrR family transcriptional regulator, tetracycline repressor protein